MDQHALTALSCRLNEFKDLVCDLVLRVKKDLILLVDPVVRQVGYPDALPHVSHGVSSAVDYMRYFVRHYELQVLCHSRILILDQQTIDA